MPFPPLRCPRPAALSAAAFLLIATTAMAESGPTRPAVGGDLLSGESLVAFLTLAALEIVLGIDNIIFIAILAGRLPEKERDKARKLGIGLAMVTRIVLLLAIGWVMQLDRNPLFSILDRDVTGKDLVLLLGGLFLIAKATYEIHHRIRGEAGAHAREAPKVAALGAVLAQVLMIDIVFSLDSVITAVGMTSQVPVMIAAIVASVLVMLAFSGPVVAFVDRHPAVKILALAFLILIGTLLVAEGFHQKIDKGYVYFAMAFAVAVEFLQMRAERSGTKASKPAA
jgi:predicted tellurium resistance membrane protein TerC